MTKNILRVSFCSVLLTLVSAVVTFGQKAVITMLDRTEVTRKLSAYSDDHLIAYGKSYELKAIYSVRFSAEDAKKANFFVEKLLASGIIVFLGGKRMDPATPNKVDQKGDSMTVRLKKQQAIDERAVSSIGLGGGLDYGSFGARLTLMPITRLNIFLGAGYALSGVGVNGGLIYNILPDKRVTPTVSAMYGSNAIINITGAPQYDKLYYGPSFGFGFRIKSRRRPLNNWQIGMIVPIRSSDYQTDLNGIKNNPSIKLTSEPGPVLFTIGYHFGFKKSQ